jgi:hypothetical protein
VTHARIASGVYSLALLLTLVCATYARAGDVSVQLDAGSGFAIKNSSGAIERLRVDEATGNLSRNGALFAHTTGPRSTFVGQEAGLANSGSSNTAFGYEALRSNTTAQGNSAFGTQALRANNGFRNSAFGALALSSNTTGGGNAAFGATALYYNSTGLYNSAFGDRALFHNTTGGKNTAFGYFAMQANTNGHYNAAFGVRALFQNTTGFDNSALGSGALSSNTTGSRNAAVGIGALAGNTIGMDNAAVGEESLVSNSSGNGNAAVGRYSLFHNTTGSGNIGIGIFAGLNQTVGSDNIYLANPGVNGENGQIKIGTNGTHVRTTIAGIHGSNSVNGIAVLVNANGVLGTATSSARFKQDVRDLDDASELLMRLHPVSFRYRPEAAPGEDGTQYGLIAEEVAKVAPELVAYDGDGRPYSVRYHVLPALLLSQNQEQQRTIEAQRRAIETLSARVAMIESERARLAPAPAERR